MREAGTATTRLPEIGERMSVRERAIDVETVASRVVALAHLAASLHMQSACAAMTECDAPSTGEGGS